MLPDELGLLSDATGMEAEPGFGGSAVPVDGSMDGGFEAESSSSASSSSKVEAPTGMCSCFTVAYYQPFFNVNTSDVQDRLKGTLAFHQREPTFLVIDPGLVSVGRAANQTVDRTLRVAHEGNAATNRYSSVVRGANGYLYAIPRGADDVLIVDMGC